jgi:long-chain acyl-CoA synthetase
MADGHNQKSSDAGGGAGLTDRTGAIRFLDLDEGRGRPPDAPIEDEQLGTAMLCSSGTTGRPKGVLRPLPDNPPSQPLQVSSFLSRLWQCEEGKIFLSPAPLYHLRPCPMRRRRFAVAAR